MKNPFLWAVMGTIVCLEGSLLASPCPSDDLIVPLQVQRTYPKSGDILPANHPILIEFSTDEYQRIDPDQEVIIQEFTDLYVSPLPPGGATYAFEVTRSFGGPDLYLPQEKCNWVPRNWDAPGQDHLLLKVFFLTFENDEAKPASLEEGKTYTVSVQVPDPENPGGNTTAFSLEFTAGPPIDTGMPPLPNNLTSSISMEASCETIPLDCASNDEKDCEVSCNWNGPLQKVSAQLDLSSPPDNNGTPYQLFLEQKEFQFSVRTILFPGEDPPSSISLSLFPDPTLGLTTACATASIAPVTNGVNATGNGLYAEGENCEEVPTYAETCDELLATGGETEPDTDTTDSGNQEEDAHHSSQDTEILSSEEDSPDTELEGGFDSIESNPQNIPSATGGCSCQTSRPGPKGGLVSTCLFLLCVLGALRRGRQQAQHQFIGEASRSV